MKPSDWPRYMIAKRLWTGGVGYYWNARAADNLQREPLGSDYGAAIMRAEQLNAYIDDWRAGRGAERSLDLGPRFGTVDWWLERYMPWTVVQRTHPHQFAPSNPFVGLTRFH